MHRAFRPFPPCPALTLSELQQPAGPKLEGRQFKSKKRNRKYSLFANIVIAAALLAIAAFVLLYGRTAPIPISETQNNHDNSTESSNDEQQEALRQTYIAKMRLYESEGKAEIANLNLQAWSPDSGAELRAQEKKAIEAFGSNKFGTALVQLDGLLEKVSQLRSIQQENFLSALEDARQKFTQGYFEQASSAINDALRYKPENQEAQQLKERIASMEAVSLLISKADIARVENNPVKEMQLLEKAIKYDPYRTDLVDRYRQLTTDHHQRTFDALLRQAYQALDNKNFRQAQKRFLEMQKIDNRHPSLALLSDKIKQSEKEFKYQNLMAKAKAAAQDDSWHKAESHYQRAQLIFPGRDHLDSHLQRAAQISRYIRIIEQALLRPERLADSQIALAMEQVIEESTEQAEYSIKLQQIITRLKNTIVEMSTPVIVTVSSDGQTHVSVLGVGVIGKVMEYKIKEGLKPGRYLFKGECRGFKDKLVEVHIKPDQPTIVRVVCDEAV